MRKIYYLFLLLFLFSVPILAENKNIEELIEDLNFWKKEFSKEWRLVKHLAEESNMQSVKLRESRLKKIADQLFEIEKKLSELEDMPLAMMQLYDHLFIYDHYQRLKINHNFFRDVRKIKKNEAIERDFSDLIKQLGQEEVHRYSVACEMNGDNSKKVELLGNRLNNLLTETRKFTPKHIYNPLTIEHISKTFSMIYTHVPIEEFNESKERKRASEIFLNHESFVNYNNRLKHFGKGPKNYRQAFFPKKLSFVKPFKRWLLPQKSV